MKEVRQQLLAWLRQDRLRMELDALDRELLVADAHLVVAEDLDVCTELTEVLVEVVSKAVVVVDEQDHEDVPPGFKSRTTRVRSAGGIGAGIDAREAHAASRIGPREL